MIRLIRPFRPPTRRTNQALSGLPGWWRSHSQASSTTAVRARGLPARLRPWSRLSPPLRYGLGAPAPQAAGGGPAARVRARRQADVGGELAPVREAAVEHLVAEHGRDLGTDPLQPPQRRDPGGPPGPLAGLRRGGRVPLPLARADLPKDQLEPAQPPADPPPRPRRPRPPFAGDQLREPLAAVAADRLVAVDALLGAQPLDPVHVPAALLEQGLPLAVGARRILVRPRRHAHGRPDARLAAVVRHQRPQQRLGVDPVGLGPPGAAVDLEAGGTDDQVGDAGRDQHAVEPEPVVAGLVARGDGDRLARRLRGGGPRLLREGQQGPGVAGRQAVQGDPGTGRGVEGDDPARLAQLDRQEHRRRRTRHRRYRLTSSAHLPILRSLVGRGHLGPGQAARDRPHRILSANTVRMRATTAKALRNRRSNSRVSLTLAAVAAQATGTPSPVVAMWYLVPRLPRSVGFRPVRSPPRLARTEQLSRIRSGSPRSIATSRACTRWSRLTAAQPASRRRRVDPLAWAGVAFRPRHGVPSRRNRRRAASTRTVSAGGCPGPGSPGPSHRSTTVAIRSKILTSNIAPLPCRKARDGHRRGAQVIKPSQPGVDVETGS